MFNLFKWLFRRSYKESAIPAEGSYVLVVIDMQPQFSASVNPDTLSAVACEIVRAVHLGNPIVLLEYANYGSTNSKLKELIGRYSRCSTWIKTIDDGSRQVQYACRFGTGRPQRFRVCGVNTHACVEATVCGMSWRWMSATVEVVKAACNDCDSGNLWESFPRRHNVVLTTVT